MSTLTDTAQVDRGAVRAGFESFAAGDLVVFAVGFHDDATWNHRNPDSLGGIKNGIHEIVAFLVASAELTAGTLRAVPELYMSDGAGHVAVLTRIFGSVPMAAPSPTRRLSTSRSRTGRSAASTSSSATRQRSRSSGPDSLRGENDPGPWAGARSSAQVAHEGCTSVPLTRRYDAAPSR